MPNVQHAVFHRLLARQIAKYLPDDWADNEGFLSFFDAVNNAYQDFEADLKQLELTLELSSKESFKELKDIKSALDASGMVVLFNRNGQVIFINDKLRNLTGFDHSRNTNFDTQLLSYDTQICQKIWDSILNGHVWNGEYPVHNKAGETLWMKDTIVPFFNELNIPTRFLSIRFDITEQVITQMALKVARQQAELALQSKSEFLSVMSHEIRTPLNAVIGISQLLMEDNPQPGQLEKLELLRFASENLLALINNILDYNKIEAGKIEIEKIPVDIHSFLRNLVKSYQFKAREKGIKLHFDHHAEYGRIKTDPTRLAQVVNNLVANAIKFTQHGSVHIKLNIEPVNETIVEVKIEVKDTGKGIATENFKKIFQLFTQESNSISRNYGGTGLGLAISSKIALLMGGSIGVESKLKKGSVFTFMFQAERVAGDYTEDMSKTGDPHQKLNLKVLVVDDNELNIFVARQILKKWNCEVEEAVSGAECLEKMRDNQFDVILLDLQMPEMDGFQTMHELNIRKSIVPVIALTADSDADIRKRVLASGMKEVVLKPFSQQYLFDLIKATTSIS